MLMPTPEIQICFFFVRRGMGCSLSYVAKKKVIVSSLFEREKIALSSLKREDSGSLVSKEKRVAL